MTDEQIIKALECCATDDGDDCFRCPYVNIVYQSGNGGCANSCRKDALDLINRQKSEIEELRERISYLEKSIDCSRKEYNRLLQKLQQAESEAIKEFAERLKNKNVQGFWDENAYVGVDDIDNLVEEMTEADK